MKNRKFKRTKFYWNRKRIKLTEPQILNTSVFGLFLKDIRAVDDFSEEKKY